MGKLEEEERGRWRGEWSTLVDEEGEGREGKKEERGQRRGNFSFTKLKISHHY